MANVCGICAHPNRDEIEQALAGGVTPKQRGNFTKALKAKHYEANEQKKVNGVNVRVVLGLKLHADTDINDLLKGNR